jgi:CubicO group peptidase (beta-lactamase class C family)
MMGATGVNDRASELARELVRRGDVPGLALAFVEGGDGETEVFGLADRARRAALTPGHVFQAASLAKCVTAWALARLAEQGRLDLDAPIERYLPRGALSARGFDPARITARRLLSHTGGISLPDIPRIEPGREPPPLDVRVIGPAGRFRYSGGGYALLARSIEEISGERFADHVARNVLEPLAMRRSSFDPSSPLAQDAATGHDERGAPLPFYRYGVPAAAGLFSTAADLARFAAAHFPGPDGEPAGRGVLAPRTIATLIAPSTGTQREDGLWAEYGLGYEVERLAGGRMLVGHHGVNRGWRALLAIEPARHRALVALANSDAAMPALDALFAAWIG